MEIIFAEFSVMLQVLSHTQSFDIGRGVCGLVCARRWKVQHLIPWERVPVQDHRKSKLPFPLHGIYINDITPYIHQKNFIYTRVLYILRCSMREYKERTEKGLLRPHKMKAREYSWSITRICLSWFSEHPQRYYICI